MLTAADIFSSHLRSLAVSLKLTGFWMSSLYFYLKPSMHDFKGIGVHTGTAYAKIGDYILGVVFHPKPSSVSDVAGIQSVHASLN